LTTLSNNSKGGLMKLRGLFQLIASAAGLLSFVSLASGGEKLHFKSGSHLNSTLRAFSGLSEKNILKLESERYFVVQFSTKITPQDQQLLKNAGAKIVRYIPDDAYLVEGNYKQLQSLKTSQKHISLVSAYLPEWKMSFSLIPVGFFARPDVNKTQKVVVQLLNAKHLNDLMNSIESKGGVVNYASEKILVATVRSNSIGDIASFSGVEWIEPYVDMQLAYNPMEDTDETTQPEPVANGNCADLNGYETGTRVMNFEASWNRGMTGRGQTVAMADTGLDTGDLSNIHQDFKTGVLKGQAFGMFSKTWNDPMGHGTHVAGSVMGAGRACGGITKGGAFEGSMIAQGMWSPMLKNLTVPPKLSDMFEPAYKDGARIHTNSWGSPKDLGKYDSMSAQVDEFVWNNPEMLVVFAAGNSGVDANKDGRIDPGSVSSPGTSKNALTVGASENLLSTGGIQRKVGELRGGADNWGAEPIFSDTISNNVDGIAMFSSRGPTTDGRNKPDIVAPGTNILSVKSQVDGASPMWGEFNKDYVYSGGTSMATPLTAGAAAVVRQYLADSQKITTPSAALVKAVMVHTAFDMYPGQFGEIGKAKGQELLTKRPTPDAGFGRVDMDKATDLASVNMQLFDEKVGIAQGEDKTVIIDLSGGGTLRATLSYSDAPGSPSVAKAIVNDLDLTITGPNGFTKTINDHANNIEMIELSGLQAGEYRVTVKGNKVPQGMAGKQPYALLISR
jgi:serine protease AprX